MTDVKTFRDQSVNELVALKGDLDLEIYKLRCELKMTRKLEKPHLLKVKKKERAQVLTVLAEKKREENGKK